MSGHKRAPSFDSRRAWLKDSSGSRPFQYGGPACHSDWKEITLFVLVMSQVCWDRSMTIKDGDFSTLQLGVFSRADLVSTLVAATSNQDLLQVFSCHPAHPSNTYTCTSRRRARSPTLALSGTSRTQACCTFVLQHQTPRSLALLGDLQALVS